MRLTDQEKAVLDGKEGRAGQKAMALLVRYGEALGLKSSWIQIMSVGACRAAFLS